MKRKLGSILVITALVALQTATAESPIKSCHKFVVDPANKTFQSLESLTGGKRRCSNNAAKLKRMGYQFVAPGSGGGNGGTTVQNPELDTERVFTGNGEVNIAKAFRVSSTARIVTVTVGSECYDGANIGQAMFVRIFPTGDYYNSVKFEGVDAGKSESFTLFDSGTYGISLENGTFTKGTCSSTIRVQ